MRSSAILSLVALATVAPTLAAPVAPAPQYTKRQPRSEEKREPEDNGAFALQRDDVEELFSRGFDGQFARDFEEHFARALVAGDDGQSGAFPWGAVIKAAPTIISAASGLYSWLKNKREFDELFTRELAARDGDESGAFWGTLLKLAPTVISAVSSIFKKNKREIDEVLARGYDEQFAREFEEQLTREILARDDLQSGAFPWAAVFKAAPTIISAANSIYGIFKGKRELEGLNARELDELFTRELEEIFSRELSTRDDDESGAFWGTLLKLAPTIISAASRIFKGKRELEGLDAREFDELFSRELEEIFSRELSARDDDESGAFWGTLIKWAPTIISAASSIFKKNKREFEDIFVRASLDELD